MNTTLLSQAIKIHGKALGFDQVGISKAEKLDQEALQLEAWLLKGNQGKMDYMSRYFDQRIDPRLLVPGAKSVISVLQNYFPGDQPNPEGVPRISTYAWGEDYHTVLKSKLYALFDYIRSLTGEILGRVFVDSAPVMEKTWAKKGGLGWVGKHTNLIHPRQGSWFFIGEIILDLELDYDGPVRDHCGTCTRCIDACPTEALSPYQIDASRCISYLTIELKSAIPAEFHEKMGGWAYGCDICQEVCPWNRFSTPTQETAFSPLEHLNLRPVEWEEITATQYKKITRKTAMSRIRQEKWLGNLRFLRLIPEAKNLQEQNEASHDEDEVAESDT